MGNLEKRLAQLEEFKKPAVTRHMSDAELAVRLYAAVNGPNPIGARLLEIVPELAGTQSQDVDRESL